MVVEGVLLVDGAFVKAGPAVLALGAQVVYHVVLGVLFGQEALDVPYWVAVPPLHAFGGIAHSNNLVGNIAQIQVKTALDVPSFFLTNGAFHDIPRLLLVFSNSNAFIDGCNFEFYWGLAFLFVAVWAFVVYTVFKVWTIVIQKLLYLFGIHQCHTLGIFIVIRGIHRCSSNSGCGLATLFWSPPFSTIAIQRMILATRPLFAGVILNPSVLKFIAGFLVRLRKCLKLLFLYRFALWTTLC